MKAVLYSLVVLALVGGLVGGGLFAYFSDTETSSGNTFTAGTIDIEITGGGNVGGYTGVEPDLVPVDFKPCEVGYLEFTVENVGQNDVDVWKHIDITNDPAGLAAVTWFDLSIDGDEVIADGQILLSEVHCKWIYLGTLTPGQIIVVVQSFHIMPDAGNEYQAAVVTFDEDYTGQQVTNPTPPGPELPPGRPAP